MRQYGSLPFPRQVEAARSALRSEHLCEDVALWPTRSFSFQSFLRELIVVVLRIPLGSEAERIASLGVRTSPPACGRHRLP